MTTHCVGGASGAYSQKAAAVRNRCRTAATHKCFIPRFVRQHCPDLLAAAAAPSRPLSPVGTGTKRHWLAAPLRRGPGMHTRPTQTRRPDCRGCTGGNPLSTQAAQAIPSRGGVGFYLCACSNGNARLLK